MRTIANFIQPNNRFKDLKNTIELISSEFESQLEQKQKEIELTQIEKENNIKDIEQEIAKFENIKKELQTITTQYLYN